MGGLGNQMFQYAFGRYLAFRNNTYLKIDSTLLESNGGAVTKRDFELQIFNIGFVYATPSEIKKFNGVPNASFVDKISYRMRRMLGIHKLVVQQGNSFKPEYLNLKANTCIVGRWQSYKYFEEVEHLIRNDFEFKCSLPTDLEPLIEAIRTTNSISIHIRRTDYVSNSLYASRLGSLPIEYYIKAVKVINSLVNDIAYFIFSDDIEWCETNLKFISGPTTYVDTTNYPNSNEIDLHLMSLCKHHIISNSTFAWWGAWLGKFDAGVTVAPNKWAISPEYDAIDIIPPNWMRI